MPHDKKMLNTSHFFSQCLYGTLTLEFCESGYEFCISKPYSFLLLLFSFFNFIYFWLRWVFVTVHGLSLVVASGGYSPLQFKGFSLRWLLLLWSTGFRRAGFSSCSAWAR